MFAVPNYACSVHPTHLINSLQNRRAVFNAKLTPKIAQIATAFGNCHQKMCGQEQILGHLIISFTPATSAKQINHTSHRYYELPDFKKWNALNQQSIESLWHNDDEVIIFCTNTQTLLVGLSILTKHQNTPAP